MEKPQLNNPLYRLQMFVVVVFFVAIAIFYLGKPALICTTQRPVAATVIDQREERGRHRPVKRYQYRYAVGTDRYMDWSDGRRRIGENLTVYYSSIAPSISMTEEPDGEFKYRSLLILALFVFFFLPIIVVSLVKPGTRIR